MNKPIVYPDYYQAYIEQVAATELLPALEKSKIPLTQNELITTWKQLGDQVYAPGKWTVKDIFQHLADCERIFCYRALRFARKDQNLLPSFDEDDFAREAGANTRSLENILAELIQIREASLALFRNFSPEMLDQTGLCMGQATSVAALGYVIAGHQAHHLKVIETRYRPMLS